MKSTLSNAAFAALLGLATVPVCAATVVNFTATEVGAFGAGPFGTVTLTQNGSDVDVKVDLRSDLNFVTTGGHTLFAFNASGVALADITNITGAGGVFPGGVNGTFSAIATATAGPPDAKNPPFGTFMFGILCTNCSNGAGDQQKDPVSFKVSNAVEADFAVLSTPNPGSTLAYFAADVVNLNGNTGAVGVVPEPEGYALALAALGVLGVFGRKRHPASA